MLSLSIKKTAVTMIVATMLLVTTGLRAQSSMDAATIAQMMTDNLAYLLTPGQIPQTLSLNTTAANELIQKAQKFVADTSISGKTLVKQVMGIMKQRNTGLLKILSPDQQKEFQEHKLEQIADLQTQIMTVELGLSNAQIPPVYEVNLKATTIMMKDVDKVKDSNGKLGKYEGVKRLEKESKDKADELKPILTPDQFATYEQNEEEIKAAIKEKMKEKKGK